jgi:tetratricopeptide (TPR) repeat protein
MTGDPQQLEAILSYAMQEAEKHTARANGITPAYVWYCLARFYDDVKRPDEALACMQRAYQFDSRHYSIRRALAEKLQSAGRLTEAEPHIRWCLARRPADKGLSAALETTVKARFAQLKTDTKP